MEFNTNVRRILAATVLCAGLTAQANASIIGGSVTGGSAHTAGGIFIELSVPLTNPFGPPNSVGNNTFQSMNLYGFDESQNVQVGPGLLVTDTGLSPIPVGTIVASHYIFFDPDKSESIIGTVDFDSDVLAIISSTARLLASDYLAKTGVNYLNPAARGLEPGDFVTISGVRQIRFDTTASTPGDYVRVLTRYSPGAVPEPGSGFLLAGGAAGLIWALRRRRTV